jgi:intein/homing endonuclease
MSEAQWSILELVDNINKTLDIDKDFPIIIDGLTGCLSGDTKIKTINGNKFLKDLSNKIIEVKSYNFNKNIIEFNKAKVFSSGTKEIYKIIFDDGRMIKATLEHTFFVKRNGKIKELKLKDIKKGDELLCD